MQEHGGVLTFVDWLKLGEFLLCSVEAISESGRAGLEGEEFLTIFSGCTWRHGREFSIDG